MPTKASRHYPALPWIIWIIGASFYLYDYVNQVIPGIIGPSLIQAFHVSAAALGTLSAYYFYSYAVMQVPVGLIVDHWGPHRPLFIAALFAAGATFSSPKPALSGRRNSFACWWVSAPRFPMSAS